MGTTDWTRADAYRGGEGGAEGDLLADEANERARRTLCAVAIRVARIQAASRSSPARRAADEALTIIASAGAVGGVLTGTLARQEATRLGPALDELCRAILNGGARPGVELVVGGDVANRTMEPPAIWLACAAVAEMADAVAAGPISVHAFLQDRHLALAVTGPGIRQRAARPSAMLRRLARAARGRAARIGSQSLAVIIPVAFAPGSPGTDR